MEVSSILLFYHRELMKAKQSGTHSIVFIVGRGLHSQNGVVKLRPAVERLIMRHNLRCIADYPHRGCLTAEFVTKEDRGWSFWDRCIVM